MKKLLLIPALGLTVAPLVSFVGCTNEKYTLDVQCGDSNIRSESIKFQLHKKFVLSYEIDNGYIVDKQDSHIDYPTRHEILNFTSTPEIVVDETNHTITVPAKLVINKKNSDLFKVKNYVKEH